jgi:hypothetical protein
MGTPSEARIVCGFRASVGRRYDLLDQPQVNQWLLVRRLWPLAHFDELAF